MVHCEGSPARCLLCHSFLERAGGAQLVEVKPHLFVMSQHFPTSQSISFTILWYLCLGLIYSVEVRPHFFVKGQYFHAHRAFLKKITMQFLHFYKTDALEQTRPDFTGLWPTRKPWYDWQLMQTSSNPMLGTVTGSSVLVVHTVRYTVANIQYDLMVDTVTGSCALPRSLHWVHSQH